MEKIVVKAPGKLFIAGEYAVLEKGQQAIVIAVDRFITCEIQANNENILSLPDLRLENKTWEIENGKVYFQNDDQKLAFVKNALEVFYQYLSENNQTVHPISILVSSELDDRSGKKYGLGSSAAVVVAVVSALFQFYFKKLDKPIIFKLSAIAHYKTQGNGSCADIAASTFGGWIAYSSFRPEWLLTKLAKERSLTDLLRSSWPYLSVKNLTPPTSLHLSVGWTKSAVSTAPMVKKIQQLKQTNKQAYEQFLGKSTKAVDAFIQSCELNNIQLAMASLTENREALQELAQLANTEIESVPLKQLIAISNKYGTGKTSGAGGGDCGIALVKNAHDVNLLYKEWQEVNIEPLMLSINSTGVHVIDTK
ncbi:phosphomevalonate kinase [Bacillus kwashiorkori]|uniref:phosphomevalonate kinase n=1 Tax=Bacillus kwashiorkori TaxID=1522318 RepID=UPI000782EFCD|nr:phosphomevalonate kinase [Bacillus kwashiorkori]